uniref:Phospholipase A2 n=1 Tax=Candidatus Kentrum sp. UNK TaxID=2126344 RepID=A0A451AVR3_9GAMM|nr:MAG: hypothetical protein BECKUNK1418G_GA0071005_100915 [Candidatus Kentron sp. UNK]VFK70118.1 MAG: hypothetical protein BECKUNK1418H_GA0071006_102415 [Candidatus Kentron sp. UNK]
MYSLLFMPILASILLTSVAVAKDFNNGCGSGWNEPFIPNAIGPLCVDFISSCRGHDNCYSRCKPGGDTYGKEICKEQTLKARTARRAACDNSFHKDMDDSCSQCDPARKGVCKGIAALYKLAVVWGGAGNFEGKEVPPWYFEFIASERAKDFDFDVMVHDLTELQKIGDLAQENELLLHEKSGVPVLRIHSIEPQTIKAIPNAQPNILVREKLLFEKIDLSEATLNSKPIRPEHLPIEDLNIEKFKREQLFERWQNGSLQDAAPRGGL